MNMGKFAVMSKTTNEAVIIDDYTAYKNVEENNGCVVLYEAGKEIVYVDCYLVRIR